MNVAQLKFFNRLTTVQRTAMFPRSNERGSIEALKRSRVWMILRMFPRSNERGSIEALWDNDAQEGIIQRFHVRMNVAQSKLVCPHRLRRAGNRFPRSNERGSIEGVAES